MMKFLPNNLKSMGKRILGGILPILMLLVTGVTAQAQQQKLIPVKFMNASVQQVLSYLDEKTEYDFVYNNDQLASLPKVSIDKSATLQEILQFCLKNSNLSYQIRGNIIVIKPRSELGAATAEAIKFSGEVKDEAGHPLPGVAVIGVGTSRGAITGAKGEFVLTLKKQELLDLQFSFLGMKPYTLNVIRDGKVTVRDPQAIRVSLESDISKIDDIVVTGVMNIAKKSFTGTSTTISRADIKRVSPTNALAAIQVFDPSFRLAENLNAGSNPNVMPELSIRGQSGVGIPELDASEISEYSLKNNPNRPVFIMDGFEVSYERVYDLDIDRIESYTILKDAAATAMYGSRAANGVVVITTTPPAAGRLNVSYDMTAGVTVPDLSSYNMMDASEKLEAERLAGIFKTDDPAMMTNLEKMYNLKLQNIERGVNTDWMALPLRNSFSHRHSVRIDGGSDDFKYDANALYDRNNGVMKDNYRERIKFGMSLQYDYKTLQFRNSADFSMTKGQESPYGSFSEFVGMMPYDVYWDEFGNPVKQMANWSNDVKRNPMYDAMLYSSNVSKNREFTDNINVRWYPTTAIRLEGSLALQYTLSERDEFRDPDSGYFLTRSDAKGSYNKSSSDQFTYDLNLKGYYNNRIGKHSVNLVVGLNTRQEKSNLNSDLFEGFPTGGFVSPMYAKDLKTFTRNPELSRLMSVLGALNYSYNDIYLFDLSGRIDGSSQFGANKRYAPFYSVGGGINVHNYKVMKAGLPWMNQFKVKATYGMTGKVNFPSYAAQNKYQFINDYWYATGDGMEIFYMGNPNLMWTKTVKTDLGVEMSLFNNLVYARATYYIENTKDDINDLTISTSSGFNKYKENVGRVRNRGYEINLQVRAVRTKNLTVNLMATAAHNENRIVEISNALKAYNDRVNEMYTNGREGSDRPMLKYVEGGSLNDTYGMVSLGIDPGTGSEMFLYRDGTVGYKWLTSENVAICNTEPKLNGSFGASILWKNFTFDCYFLYSFGGQMYNETLLNKVERANIRKDNNDRRVLTDRWAVEGDVSRFRNINDFNKVTLPTSRFVQDYNYLKMSSVSLGYEFPRSKIEKIGFRRLKISANMSDVFTASSIRIERGTSSPFARTFNLSLGASF